MGISALKRKTQIKDVLKSKKNVFVNDLVEKLEVSEVTIRRDLMQLEKEGYLLRTYGGAVKVENGISLQYFFQEKAKRQMQEKLAIAIKAVSFIEEGDTIFLNSGTTTRELAKALRDRPDKLENITLVTSCVPVLWEVGSLENLKLIVLGGIFRPKLLDLCGPQAERDIQQYNLDKAFLGVDGISAEKGLSATDSYTAHLEGAAINSSRKVFVLADYSKVGKNSLISYADVSQIDMLITDSRVSKDELVLLSNAGVEVEVVDIKKMKNLRHKT